jgi:hypothetical protein
MVPVTTKPYVNRASFIMILLQGVPAFFLFIQEKSKNILIPATAGKKEDIDHGSSAGI